MTTLHQDIRAALTKRAITAVGFPAEANRAFDGKKYKPVVGTPYARLQFFPSASRPMTTSAARKTHRGMFWVTFFGKPNEGTAALETLAGALKDVFTPDTVLHEGGENIAIEYAEARPFIDEPDWAGLPVVIGWTCYSLRN